MIPLLEGGGCRTSVPSLWTITFKALYRICHVKTLRNISGVKQQRLPVRYELLGMNKSFTIYGEWGIVEIDSGDSLVKNTRTSFCFIDNGELAWVNVFM